MALRDQPYLPLYVQDFLTDEKLANCSAESTGVYIRVMCLMHKSHDYGKILLRQKFKQTDRQILNFAKMLARQMPYEADVIERALTELVEEEVLFLDGDCLCQKRMIKDGEISDKRSKSGKKGAEKLHEGKMQSGNFAKSFATAKAVANSEIENEYENESEIDSDIKDIAITKQRSTNRLTKEQMFEIFWEAYPNKKAKGDARRAFNKVKVPLEVLLNAIEAQKHSRQWTKDGGQFIPYPATWLNREGWGDKLNSADTSSGNVFLDLLRDGDIT